MTLKNKIEVPRIPGYTNKMKIIATSDLHNCLPDFSKVTGDVLVVAGDVTGVGKHDYQSQSRFINYTFLNWCKELKANGNFEHIVVIAGNHDIVWEKRKDLIQPQDTYIYLQDSEVIIDGIKFYGVPWTKPFFDWGFNARDEKRQLVWDNVPDDVDVLISHGPPRLGNLDVVINKYYNFVPEFTGDAILNKCIERVQPEYVFCGHIHENSGEYIQVRKTIIHNVSYLDGNYEEPGVMSKHKGYVEVTI